MGRPRRSYRKYKKSLNLLVQIPPRCVCGALNYRYRIYEDLIWVICNQCGYKRYYLAKDDVWVSEINIKFHRRWVFTLAKLINNFKKRWRVKE